MAKAPHPREFWAMPVRTRQAFLSNRGYRVKLDGKSGPQTFTASWAYQHHIPPKVFNAQGPDWYHSVYGAYGPKPRHSDGGFGIARLLNAAKKITAPKPVTHGRNTHAPNQPKAHGGNTNPPGNAKVTNQSYGPPVAADALPPGLEIDVDEIKPAAGNVMTKLNADTYANTAAGAEFDPQIYDVRTEQAKLAAAAPHNLEEISRLYGNVETAQAGAAAQNVRAGESIAGSQDALVKGLVASLGGAANAGAGSVAQAGVDSAAYLRSLDQIQRGTDQNIGVALKAEEADARVNQGRMDTGRASDLAAQLMGLQGQRGGAAAAARLDALKYNNDVANQNFQNVQHIREVNLDAQQQEFQNRIAAQNAIIAARAAGDSHTAALLQNAYAMQFPGQAFGKSISGGKKGHTVTPSDINRAVKTAQSSVMVTVKNPETGATRQILDPRLQHNVKALVTAVNAGFSGLHSTNKAALAARNRILRMYGVTPQPGWNF